ncbi:hypothetical protein D3C81_1799620 [compost metagenome]
MQLSFLTEATLTAALVRINNDPVAYFKLRNLRTDLNYSPNSLMSTNYVRNSRLFTCNYCKISTANTG